ncbi:Forkhead-associated domain-containing protein, putative isoform 2 [Hibiscus syriacus]|uniref:Forkhead-associated domain-containing protein, putative isoform 2 n=1 Tax=Hibiscus syriacus TaxID=106335 RepID=A0A6A2YFX4_HIBSY|nr:Forkhead-associated domain-containing protein, putative isoform 2 [Hibiscus syriacus]
MSALPASVSSSWIPEDDLLLKNVIETSASLEALAKGAVQFSRKFTVRELQDRWRALPYDPVISDQAAALLKGNLKALEARIMLRGRGPVVMMSLLDSVKTVKNRLGFGDLGIGNVGKRSPEDDLKVTSKKDCLDKFGHPSRVEEIKPYSAGCSSPQPDMPLRKTMEDVPAAVMPVNDGLEDKGQHVRGEIVHPEDLDTETDALLNFDGDTIDKSCYESVNLLLLNSPNDVHEDDTSKTKDPETLVSDDPEIPCNDDVVLGKALARKECHHLSSDQASSFANQKDSKEEPSLIQTEDILSQCFTAPKMVGLDILSESSQGVKSEFHDAQCHVISRQSQNSLVDHIVVLPILNIRSYAVPITTPNPLQRCFPSQNRLFAAQHSVALLPVPLSSQCRFCHAAGPALPSSQCRLLLTRFARPLLVIVSMMRITLLDLNRQSNLKMTPGHGLIFKKHEDKIGNLVKWRSKKQSVISKSSVEAEYRAIALRMCEGIWLQRLLTKLEMCNNNYFELQSDSKSAISIAKNLLADVLTKTLPRISFDEITSKLAHTFPNSASDGAAKEEPSDECCTRDISTYAEASSIVDTVLEPEANKTSDQIEYESDDDVPSFSDIEAMILEMNLCPKEFDSLIRREVSRYQAEHSKRTIIRLEQGARSAMQRAIASHEDLAVIYGIYMKHYVKETEVILGRENKDVDVDVVAEDGYRIEQNRN